MIKTKIIKLAVITGGKTYNVIHFNKLFQSIAGIDSYIQYIDDFTAAPEAVRDNYDVVPFSFMMLAGPMDQRLPGYSACNPVMTTKPGLKKTVERLKNYIS